MRDRAALLLHALATVARLAGSDGARTVVAESVFVKHQLLILNRSRKRSPNLRPGDRVVADLCAVFMHPGRLIRAAIAFQDRHDGAVLRRRDRTGIGVSLVSDTCAPLLMVRTIVDHQPAETVFMEHDHLIEGARRADPIDRSTSTYHNLQRQPSAVSNFHSVNR